MFWYWSYLCSPINFIVITQYWRTKPFCLKATTHGQATSNGNELVTSLLNTSVQQHLKISFQNTNKSEEDYPREQLWVLHVLMWWLNDLPTQLYKIKNVKVSTLCRWPRYLDVNTKTSRTSTLTKNERSTNYPHKWCTENAMTRSTEKSFY